MKNLLYFLLFLQFNMTLTLDCLDVLYRTIARGYYRDVLSEVNGGLFINARDIYFYGNDHIGPGQTPLRNNIYFNYPGHARCAKPTSMVFQLIQPYEINTIKIRFWDYDTRIHTFKVFIQKKGTTGYVKVYEGSVWGLLTIKFEDQQVQQILIENFGNSQDINMSIIKIQIFYSFRNSVM